jgi:two-component sensor histidine kinase
MLAASHPRQPERIAALRGYDILDTPREADFDDIARLASELCGVPISVINLIDADRQWFKAEVGLGVRETPLDTSICSHVILENEFVEIPDTLKDRRMQDNALCRGDPGLRFYAGALLQTEDGLPLGTLCVLDYQPRALSSLQRHALQVLAKQVMAQLDLRRALKRQELMQKEIDHRVKNSLASVASLVRLQMTSAGDPKIQSALESVAQRIQTVALLHEELYRTGAADEADLGHYLQTLREMLQVGVPAHIAIDVQAQRVPVDSATASAVGKIVSEFVMNSIKYAFPDERRGTVTIALRPTGDGIELICRDDGIGAGNLTPARRGLGMRLMDAYAAQLGGRAQFSDAHPGVELRILLPRN